MPSSLEELVRHHLGWLRSWLGARLRGRRSQDADDLCQDILLRALNGYGKLRRPERFAPWLYRIAVNRLRDYLRKEARQEKILVGMETDIVDPRQADEEAARAEEVERAIGAVLALPKRYREPMLLRHVGALSYSEIAGILGVGENTVQVRIHRARRMLRRSAFPEEREGSGGDAAARMVR